MSQHLGFQSSQYAINAAAAESLHDERHAWVAHKRGGVMWRDDAMACSHWWKPPINTAGILGLSKQQIRGQRQTVQTTTTDRLAKKLSTAIAC